MGRLQSYPDIGLGLDSGPAPGYVSGCWDRAGGSRGVSVLLRLHILERWDLAVRTYFGHGLLPAGGERMATERGTQVSEAQIAVHWREEDYHHPPAKFVGQANAADPAIFERFSEEHFPECFKEYADLLTWDAYWHTTLDTSNAPFWKWFVGGRLNACYNCVDRHLATSRNKAALIWVPEPETEETQAITYQELYSRVNEFAALLRDFCGVQTGDRVTFHLPMVPELPVSMLACARLGVIHSEVFGGFSGVACGERISDSGSRVLVTMDGYYRNGELIDHKANADVAVAKARELGSEVDKVLVWRRHPGQCASKTPMVAGRDFFVDELLPDYRRRVVKPVSMPAEAPLFLMYTSGTTAQPKGCQHSTGGYLAYVTGTSKYYQDIHPEDTYWCLADIGWITGHSYIVYGPLSLGTTSVMYEGVPMYPDPGRPWRIAERLGVTIFHTAPTTIRMLRKVGPDEPAKYDCHFKHMTTVGEPIEPNVWRWYHDVVGKGESGHRRHLVADRERGVPGQHPARSAADEARELRPGGPWDLPCDLRRERRGGRSRKRPGRKHLHPQPLAWDLPDHLGPARAVRGDLLQEVLPATGTARTGTTGRTSRATARSRPPTGTSGSSAGSTT